MAIGRSIDFRRTPGQIAFGMTVATGAFPHTSGTAIGKVARAIFTNPPVITEIRAAELRGHVWDTWENREELMFKALIRGADPDAINHLFPNVAIGASGRAMITYPPATKPAKGSARGTTLFFSPDNPDQHDGLWLYNAVPYAAEDVSWLFSQKGELVIAAKWLPLPNSSNQIYQLGPPAEMAP